MEQVLYVLGAGFSAPLGVPVMSNFLEAARAIRREGGEDLSYFDETFGEIERIAAVKNWVNSDQHNLEEVLSIVEMQDVIADNRPRDGVRRMICEVIKRRTPAFEVTEEELRMGNWIEFVMGRHQLQGGYVGFVSHLLGIELQSAKKTGVLDGKVERSLDFQPLSSPPARYAVLTFNYDMVLENCVRYLNDTFSGQLAFGDRPNIQAGRWSSGCPLIKLHGSIEGLGLTLPTWTKGPARKETMWPDAVSLISTATQIRFVGFSFSKSDAHFEYLIKASLATRGQLNRVDVICRDPSLGVRARYAELFDGPRQLRFADINFRDFINELSNEYRNKARGVSSVQMTLLESLHDALMGKEAALR